MSEKELLDYEESIDAYNNFLNDLGYEQAMEELELENQWAQQQELLQ